MWSPAPGPSSSRAGSTEWLAAVKPSLRPSTYSLYSTAVTSWITPRIGALKLAEVTPQVVQRLYTDLATSGGRSGQGLSPRSVRLAHQVLQQAFAKAVQWKLTANNPLASGIILPRMEPKEMKTLSAEDAKAFLDATADDRLGPLWCLLLTTGLRRGEALGLRWTNVDLADARLEVRQTVVAVKGTPLISEPKTKAGRRNRVLVGEDHGGGLQGSTGSPEGRSEAGRERVGGLGPCLHDDDRGTASPEERAAGLPDRDG